MLELVQKYLSMKVNVRYNTQANYNFVEGILKKEAFGGLRIDKVKLSDAKAMVGATAPSTRFGAWFARLLRWQPRKGECLQ